MLGDCYGPEFFQDIKNNKIRSALTQIATETQEDLAYYESVLKDFGCNVLRPKLDTSDSIMNYVNSDGAVAGNQGVPRAPLQPRDCQLVIGNDLFYTGTDHSSIKQSLDRYNSEYKLVPAPITENSFNNFCGNDAPDWPTYNEYCYRYLTNQDISDIKTVIDEFNRIHNEWHGLTFIYSAPCITVIGRDVYIDIKEAGVNYHELYLDKLQKIFSNFRFNSLTIGGHNDGCFHAIKPGAILSLNEIQIYENTFPDWDVCYLPNQSWSKVGDFLKLKNKVYGKWWLPGQESNDDFTNFVETWLQDWVGYVEETVFDVNVLVLDEHHVCVSNPNNQTVNAFLKKHKMEPVYVPWRHRYFWDGGLHCITLDLYREGKQQDYFPDRKNFVVDAGFD